MAFLYISTCFPRSLGNFHWMEKSLHNLKRPAYKQGCFRELSTGFTSDGYEKMVVFNRTNTVNRGVVYIVVFVMLMFLSYAAKRGVVTGCNAVKATVSKRSFSFSSAWSQGSSHNGGSAASAAVNNFGSSSAMLMPYNIAVAYQPKDREESNLFRKKHNKPSPATTSPTGEDNLFVSTRSPEGYVAVGVADGVGGWSEAGYDSSAISRELCASMKDDFEHQTKHLELTPKKILIDAFKEITNSPKVEIGGTTACLGILTPDYKLQVANLGDSWCGLFRGYKLINETNFQTHNFNTPYQLAKIPAHIIRQAELDNRRYIVDSPEIADEYTWDLQKDDLIMFATDGVTDNVIPNDIELFLKDQFELTPSVSLDEVSKTFVKQVVKVSKDVNFPSAFAQELSRLTGQKYLGGKEDDITVVLIKVT